MNVDSQESNLSILEATNEILKAAQPEVTPEESQEEQQENTQEVETAETDQTEETETEEVESVANDPEEETAEVTEEEAEAEEPLYTVKIDGETEQVTLDELQSGYMREKTFHRRLNKLSQDKKQTDQEVQQYRQTRDQYAQGLQQIIAANQMEEPNWQQLKQTLSPEEYSSRVADYQVYHMNMSKVQEQQKQIAQEQQQEAMIGWQNYVGNEAKTLMEKMPEWNKERQDETIKYAKDVLGFTQEEINGAADHRMILAINKSMRYDKLMNKTPEVKKKIKAAPKSTKSGTPISKNQVINNQKNKLRQNFIKNPSKEAAIELLMNR
tara:strand:+ start:233 stop:1207 length:975 start_codon:yes stop_codon:yes gene_type:complete